MLSSEGLRRATAIVAAAVLALVLVVVVLIIVGLTSSPARADTTFTVNSTGDDGDAAPEGTCDSNPTVITETCTLREAIQEANFVAGADTIKFDIPGNGPHTISPTSELPTITDPLTIDGYTQGDSTTGTTADDARENTLAFGSNAVLKIILSGAGSASTGANGLEISSGPTTIRGLVINGFQKTTSNSGGHAILFFPPEGNTNNVVAGNFIGTDAAGTAPVPNEGNGVSVGATSTGNTIGGATPAARNLISGNGVGGVAIFGSGNLVTGNLIGTDKNGTAGLGNGNQGIDINADNNVVTDNVAAFNGNDGVSVGTDGVGNRILNNSIFQNAQTDNDGQGINLVNGGRQQDPKDPDTGANNFQNYPVITQATSSGTATTIKGTLNSRPRKTFTIQFFSNPFPFGSEGKNYLGQVNVRTKRNGTASFTLLGPAVATGGNTITATATNLSTGDTSEFSDPAFVVAAS